MRIKTDYEIWEVAVNSDGTRPGLGFVNVTTHPRFGQVAIATDGKVAVWVPVEIERDDVEGLVPAWLMKRAWLRQKEITSYVNLDLRKNGIGCLTGAGFGLDKGHNFVSRQTELVGKKFSEIDNDFFVKLSFPSQKLDTVIENYIAFRHVEYHPFFDAELLLRAQKALGNRGIRVYGGLNKKYPGPQERGMYILRGENPHAWKKYFEEHEDPLTPPFGIVMPLELKEVDF